MSEPSEPVVDTFFYGSYMSPRVLRESDLSPSRIDVAQLPGYDLTIGPLANVVPSPTGTVYGVVAPATHAELDRLYAHARDVLGGVYLPHPVLVLLEDGRPSPALCYIAPELPAAPASRDYVTRILEPAREHGFPEWYLRRVESFLPDGTP